MDGKVVLCLLVICFTVLEANRHGYQFKKVSFASFCIYKAFKTIILYLRKVHVPPSLVKITASRRGSITYGSCVMILSSGVERYAGWGVNCS